MRRTKRTNRRLAGAVLVVGTLVAVGCGSDDDGDSADTTTGDTAVTEETAATEDTTPTEDTTEDTVATEDTMATETTEAEGAGSGLPECPETEGAVVGYSEPLPDPNFAIIEAVLGAQLEAAGATLAPVNAQLDPAKQVSDVQALQEQGIDVLLINPVAPEPVAGILAEVAESGVPVIVQDTNNDDGTYTSSVIADVEAAAAAGAAELKELVGDGAVGAIIGPPFAEVLVREAEAFAAAAAEVGLNVIDTQQNGNPGSPDGARALAEAWKLENPDLAGIWTFNDTSAVGVASAFDDAFQPALVSINGQPEAIPLVEEGRINATFDLQQDVIARALAYAALGALCGEELPTGIFVAPVPIDETNVGDWVSPEERGLEPATVALEESEDGRTFIVVQS
jgi:ribose transport system substrate-binding protein